MNQTTFRMGESLSERRNIYSDSDKKNSLTINTINNKMSQKSKVEDSEKFEDALQSSPNQTNFVINDNDIIEEKRQEGFQKQEQNISSKLLDIIRRLRLRQAARILINSTRSRMLKSMKPHQYAFINDKSQDFQDLQKGGSSKFKLGYGYSQYKKGLFFKTIQYILKLFSQIPIINPSNSFKLLWDIMISIALLYSFYVIPTMVSFGLEERDVSHEFFIEILLTINVIDIVIKCNTGFYKRGVLCSKRSSTWRKYYNEQLSTDLWSLIPLLIYRLLQNKVYHLYFQFITLSILIKWQAVIKLFNSIQQRYILRPNIRNTLSLLNLFFKILLIAHACACLWIVSGRVSLNYYGPNWFKQAKILELSWQRQYLSAFYFCTVTMVTVGYGDVVPQSPIEITFCIIMMFFACGVFGFSVNTIQTILNDFSKNEKKVMDKLFIIKNYLVKKSINPSLAKDVTEYLEYYWRANQETNLEEEEKMVKQLPDSLRNDLLIESNRIVLRDCQIFQNNFSEDVIKATIPIIQEKYYTPFESIFSEGEESSERSIYFVQEGVVELYIDSTNYFNQGKKGAIRQFKTIKRLKKGDFFGELEFFTNENKDLNVRSVNFSTLLKIDRIEFLKILKHYPQDYEQFCYIRDRLVLQHDYSKICQKCPSCLSDKHTLEWCPYLHFNPNKPKLLAKENTSFHQKRNQIPKEQQQLRQRQRIRQLYEVNIEAYYAYIQFNGENIEDYIDKYLQYNVSKCEVCVYFYNNNSNLENNQKDAQSLSIQKNQQELNSPQDYFYPYQNPNTMNNSNCQQIYSNFSNAKVKERDGLSQIAPIQSSFNHNIEEMNLQAKMSSYKKAYFKVPQSKANIQEEFEQNECNSPKLIKLQGQNQKHKNPKRIFENENIKQNSNTNQSYPITLQQQSSSNQPPLSNLNFGSQNQIQSILQPVYEYEDNRNGQISPNMHRSSFSSIQAINSGQYGSSSQQIIHQESLKKQNRNQQSIVAVSEREYYQKRNQFLKDINHTSLIFFDLFLGQFERMHQFQLYYPLNNYQFVISQIDMDIDLKKKLKHELLEQQRKRLNKIMEKKRPKNRSSKTSGIGLQSTYENKTIKRLVDKFELESRIAKNSTKQSNIVQNLQAQSTIIGNNNVNNSNILVNSAISFSKKNRESFAHSPSIIRPAKTFMNNENSDLESQSQIENQKTQIENQRGSIDAIRKIFQLNGKSQTQGFGISPGNSGHEIQNSDISNINSSQPLFRYIGQDFNDQSYSNLQNTTALNLILSSNNDRAKSNRKLDLSTQKMIAKEINEIERDQILDVENSPPKNERKVLNYEHLETPNISVFQYNSQIEEFNQKF